MSSRRGFIGGSVGAALAGSAGAAGEAAVAGSPYDLAAVRATLHRPSRHRQVFGVARVADGLAIGQMRHSLDAYETALGEGPGSLHVAAVFYGRGVVMLLDDRAWRTYALAQGLRQRGDTPVREGDGNPYWSDGANGPALHSLAMRGASFFACDNALADWAAYIVSMAGASDRSLDEIHRDLRARLVPGALLVPAGVAALNMAQEAHFTYVQATL
jgi:intracellular sulfur oxidation DsrE/DsrF family protein